MKHFTCTVVKQEYTDMNIYQYGCEKCAPDHSFGPAIRDHYLIHYIADGEGIYQVGKNTYHLHKGQGFLITPNILTYYQADHKKPWQYYWIGFHGLKAQSYLETARLCMDKPIFTYDKDEAMVNCFEQLLLSDQFVNGKPIFQLGQLYIFLSLLVENAPERESQNSGSYRKEQYIKNAVNLIQTNYSRKITISSLAHYVSLDRSYFCALFKEFTNMSPQNFLINYRMNKACEFMKTPSLSIGDIARSVGYEDPLVFSKVFKKTKGMSPKHYRKSLIISGVF
jgi:AraC-like DNA-binding protein